MPDGNGLLRVMKAFFQNCASLGLRTFAAPACTVLCLASVVLVLQLSVDIQAIPPSFTVSAKQTVIRDNIDIEVYNAVLSYGKIRSAKVFSVDGSIIADFLAEIDPSALGLQSIIINMQSSARGVYLVVVETEREQLVVKVIKE